MGRKNNDGSKGNFIIGLLIAIGVGIGIFYLILALTR